MNWHFMWRYVIDWLINNSITFGNGCLPFTRSLHISSSLPIHIHRAAFNTSMLRPFTVHLSSTFQPLPLHHSTPHFTLYNIHVHNKGKSIAQQTSKSPWKWTRVDQLGSGHATQTFADRILGEYHRYQI